MFRTQRVSPGDVVFFAKVQISGDPARLDSVHYDITARAQNSPTRDEALLMLD